jgi:hypothetical protein
MHCKRQSFADRQVSETIHNAVVLIRAVTDNPMPMSRAALRGFANAIFRALGKDPPPREARAAVNPRGSARKPT